MRSRTSIVLYVGLILFVAGLGFTCFSIVLTVVSLVELHRLKTQSFSDGSYYDSDAYGYAYAPHYARLSTILAFYVLLAVAFAIWLVALTVFLVRVRRDDVARRARLLRAFCIVFCSIATALAVFGAVVFAVSFTDPYGEFPAVNLFTLAVWLACMVLAIATCVVVSVDKRDVNKALQGGDSGSEEMAEAAS